MELNEFIVGKSYRYSEVSRESSDDIEVNEYGPEYLGQNAIHIREHKTLNDLWFIWIAQTNEGILKCVYNSEFDNVKAKRIIEIKFEGIDNWNRPIFKDTKSNNRFGDVDNLFSYSNGVGLANYIKQVEKEPESYLEWFGTKFGCEPHGGLNSDIELVVIME